MIEIPAGENYASSDPQNSLSTNLNKYPICNPTQFLAPQRPARRKDTKQEILWSKNLEWTEALVAILVDDEAIRNGLFHDPKIPLLLCWITDTVGMPIAFSYSQSLSGTR